MELRPIYANELYHHGISGMRWGRRNGPPYPLSANAHSSEERKFGTSDWSKEAQKEARKGRLDRAFTPSEKSGKDKPNVSPAEKIVKNSKDALNATADLRKKIQILTSDPRKDDVKQMSDEELRKRINRLDMEKKYFSLTEDEVNNGKDYFDKFVDIGNDVATLALAVGGIVAMIKKIQKIPGV